jgi:hypothetical protein
MKHITFPQIAIKYYWLLVYLFIFSCEKPPKIIDKNISYPFSISQINNISIDAEPSEWENIPFIPLTPDENAAIDTADFKGHFKLGWTTEGLVFFVQVEDDFLKEESAPILQNDGLELFIAKEQGSKQMIQYIISPGISEAFPVARIEKVDYGIGQNFSEVKDMQVMAEPTSNGFQVEGFIPFSSLGFSLQKGDTFAFRAFS